MLDWLLDTDPALRWQVLRDLAGAPEAVWTVERARVAETGWGADLLARQRPDAHWGRGAYQPKWTCTTYTLRLLAWLGLPPGNPGAVRACGVLLDEGLGRDGGLDFSSRRQGSETCITGLVLTSAACLAPDEPRLARLVAHLLAEQMPDGGWNCQRARGATHASFHTTMLALEGLTAAGLTGPAIERGAELLLAHRLFRSHRTGAVVHPALRRFAFPPWWHYDVLRALEWFAATDAPRDPRLSEGVAMVEARRGPDGRWPAAATWPGAVHFPLEAPGEPSRWNTLRALRVLRWWGR